MPVNRDYTTTGFHKLREGAGEALNAGDPMNANQLRRLRELQGPDGDLTNGGSVKPRFLTTDTATRRMPSEFDDDVMRALREGQELEDELRRKLEALKKNPYGTEEPDAYRVTSDDYIDMTGIDPSSWRVREEDPNDPSATLDVYRSRYNNVEKEGPKRRERTQISLQRQLEVNPKELRNTLTGTTRSQLPRGYEPWSAKDWRSTTHTEHTDYDREKANLMNTRDATEPLRNRNYALTQDHELAVSQKEDRLRTRNQGEWNTEYTENFEDRLDQASVDKSHAVKGVWDIKNGVYTINPHFHHPRDDTDTGELYTASQIVPGQYTTMSQQPLHGVNYLGSTK
ncbi:hypothetical protein AGDE_07026 [Angomonas deanei]|nr:hypothetical protein AGDE_07026 [Angomonas deanei]|eukprot:EPY36213.1 hypothetical protein AGDE_07026 [Angomonas deanei]